MARGTSQGAASVVDGLKAVYQEVASLGLAPDAQPHMQMIQQLQQAVLGIIQQLTEQKSQQAAQMQAQQRQQAINPMMGGPQQGSGMARPVPGSPGGPPSQGSPGMVMPDADEMRRMLQSQGQGG